MTGKLNVLAALPPVEEPPFPPICPTASLHGMKGMKIFALPGNQTAIPQSFSLGPSHYTDCMTPTSRLFSKA